MLEDIYNEFTCGSAIADEYHITLCNDGLIAQHYDLEGNEEWFSVTVKAIDPPKGWEDWEYDCMGGREVSEIS